MRAALRPFASLLVVTALVGGCSPKRIAGTDIKDSPDTRAVVDTIEKYRVAAESRNADAVMALVSPAYYDNGGTADPSDDVDADRLRKRLVEDYAKLTWVSLEIAIKRIDIEGDRATAYIFFDERYRMKMKSGEVAKQASDIHRMQLAREQGGWRFIAGI